MLDKCIVVSTPGAKFSALAFKEDFKESISKVAGLGFDAVELAIRNPLDIDVELIKELVEGKGLRVVAIGTGQAYGEEGLSFTSPSEDIRRKAVERIKHQIDFASNFGAQVIIGLIRGKASDGLGYEKAVEAFCRCMEECARYAEEKGVILTVEPINRYETDLFNTVEEVAGIINRLGADSIRLLVDTFHMNIEEPDIFESTKKVKDYISHVHVADSNRWAPGCGHIDFAKFIDTLKEIGYEGALSAEILPKPDSYTSARLTIEHMKSLGL